jgi:hypothetical protein
MLITNTSTIEIYNKVNMEVQFQKNVINDEQLY